MAAPSRISQRSQASTYSHREPSARCSITSPGSHCLEFTSDSLAETVRCPHCGYVPRQSTGPTAKAQVEELDEEMRKLRANWAAALHDSIKPTEIAKASSS